MECLLYDWLTHISSNYATMRFEPEALHGANNGLNIARGLMENVKQEFPWISYGDLWTLGGVAAIQVCELLSTSHHLLTVIYPVRKCPVPKSLGEPVASMASLRMLLPTVVFPTPLRARTISGMYVACSSFDLTCSRLTMARF